ncbi:NADH-quinone oxidoreductase subunit NuoE [Leptolinea tardivitalis]|uniref:NADH-quinone oxidoreductase subunit NuoE n=1 Tax=Leptolinea tardivitalis TaxID=229920 RepID=UPI0007802388|nr:NADH-quinone oxidoreductase subunit NuoE [Leptolinea tardivitalis]GAP22924.1 NADH:ubiquinone oxidoreductase 24 kD subunit [Leptolinea tardivitalis]
MVQNTKQSDVANSVIVAVKAAVDAFGAKREEMIPILNEINKKLGYIPPEALDEVSMLLKAPKSQLYSVASFYRMLSTKPRGRHVIQFCESAPCHVVGGKEVWEELQKQVHLKSGETSPDGKWTLLTTSCLGVCGVGPVMTVDEDIYGNIAPGELQSILARYE